MEILFFAVLLGLIPGAIASSKGHNFFIKARRYSIQVG